MSPTFYKGKQNNISLNLNWHLLSLLPFAAKLLNAFFFHPFYSCTCSTRKRQQQILNPGIEPPSSQRQRQVLNPLNHDGNSSADPFCLPPLTVPLNPLRQRHQRSQAAKTRGSFSVLTLPDLSVSSEQEPLPYCPSPSLDAMTPSLLVFPNGFKPLMATRIILDGPRPQPGLCTPCKVALSGSEPCPKGDLCSEKIDSLLSSFSSSKLNKENISV